MAFLKSNPSLYLARWKYTASPDDEPFAYPVNRENAEAIMDRIVCINKCNYIKLQ